MKAIGVVSWKGGTGKTTLAFNLAERATHDGIDTTLCDFDPQTNALDYFRIRDSYNPDAMRIKGVKGDLSLAGIATLSRQTRRLTLWTIFASGIATTRTQCGLRG